MKVEVDVSSRKCDADVDALAARLEREGTSTRTLIKYNCDLSFVTSVPPYVTRFS